MKERINESWEDASPILVSKVKDFLTALSIKKLHKRLKEVNVRHRSGPTYKDGGLRTARMIIIRLRMNEEKFWSKLEAFGHFTDEEFEDDDRPDFFVVRKRDIYSDDTLYELSNGGFLMVEASTDDDPRHIYVILYRDKDAVTEDHSARILR